MRIGTFGKGKNVRSFSTGQGLQVAWDWVEQPDLQIPVLGREQNNITRLGFYCDLKQVAILTYNCAALVIALIPCIPYQPAGWLVRCIFQLLHAVWY